MSDKIPIEIDQFDIVFALSKVLDADLKNVEQRTDAFIALVEDKLGAKITPQEHILFLETVIKICNADGGSNERLQAVDYIIELQWITSVAFTLTNTIKHGPQL